jgi:diguanylate cyclase (GGDEF)-like protein
MWTVIAIPFGQMKLLPQPGFMPAFGTVSLLTDGLTAVLLMVQAGLSGNRPAMRLGAAYLFAGVVTIPHLLAFPGVLAAGPLIGGSDTAVWLWCAWHGGFAICVIRYVLGVQIDLRPGDLRRMIAGTVLTGTTLAVIAAMGPSWLPTLLHDGRYDRMNQLGIGPALLGCSLGALGLVVGRLRFRSTLATWLAVAMLATTFDVSLTLLGGGRFTFGWYTARVLSLVTGISVLFALLSELMREAGHVAQVNTRLEQLLHTDVLTGVANRRAFDEALMAEWRRGNREQTPLSLLMIDIDCFKGFNDRYGHPAGDICLREVASRLGGQVQRPGDMAARVGGEEFAILLPSTDEVGAWNVAERVRAGVANLQLSHSGSELGFVTVSVGVATVRPPDLELLTLVSMADRALYQAKAAGRNAVRAYREPEPARLPSLAFG